MTAPAAKPGDLVLVDWVDSHTDGSWQFRADAVSDAKRDGMDCQTVGFLLETTDTFVLVAGSQTGARTPCVAGTMQIPQVAITEIRRLQVGRVVAR